MERSFRQELSSKIVTLIGYPLSTRGVTHDNPGFHYYIQNLRPGYPVLVMDYHVMPHERPYPWLVLPYADYQRLERAEVTVDDYIANSHFNFGYYWGGGSIYGAYWQPFEEETGIHDTERIRRYLWQLACRTYQHSLHYLPPKELCESCPLEASSCYCSQLNETGDQKFEVFEIDRRKELQKALIERITGELEFEVCGFLSHTGAKNDVELYAGSEPGTVRVYASCALLNELLYEPKERDFKQLAKELRLIRKSQNSEIAAEITDEMPNKHQACLAFWGSEMPSEPKSVPGGTISKTPSEKRSIWSKIAQVFRRHSA